VWQVGIGSALLVALVAVTALVGLYVLVIVWGSRSADTTARIVSLPVDLARRLLLPAWAAIRRLRVPSGPTWLPSRLHDEALRLLVQADEEDEPMEDEEIEMIAGIIELGDTRVREVMVPRIDMVAIPVDATLDTALDAIIQAGHSRIPVYRESIDDIAGLLYAKDLLKAFRARDHSPDLAGLLREAYFVPQSKAVDELLRELKTRKTHMAIVVDEYGGTAGLVTIEDLLEEIVGEIQDEYDHEMPRIETVSDTEVVCNAGVDIDDINRLMGISLPTDRVDTLAGLVFTELGKVPEPGDLARFEDADIEVLALDGRRIHRVRVVRRPPLAAAPERRVEAPSLEQPAAE
jgi:CBS domain containing-hemolysin-like protein